MDDISPIAIPPSLLGESPFWHPDEQRLYWCDIPGRVLNRYDPKAGAHEHWSFDSEPGCCAPLREGGVLLAMRDGLWRFDPGRGTRHKLANPPYDPAKERFNDGKADALGRLWVGTIYEPRDAPNAALYRYARRKLERIGGDITVSNGLAFSPDARTLYWSDTSAHTVHALDYDLAAGMPAKRRVFARFPKRDPEQPLSRYGGRPDGAAVDVEGGYWVAMFEGARLLRLSPHGEVLRELALPAQCPTMPCFGDADLKTLYITTARDKRPPAELLAMPWSGCVLRLRVDVAGLPVNFAQL
jgi:sugar lactone lactonase YvrE